MDLASELRLFVEPCQDLLWLGPLHFYSAVVSEVLGALGALCRTTLTLMGPQEALAQLFPQQTLARPVRDRTGVLSLSQKRTGDQRSWRVPEVIH